MTKAAEKAHQTTPGVSPDAEAIDRPPTIGPRDALTDPDPNDVVPGLEEKGYHTGLVRQPAEPVGVHGRTEGFRTVTDMPSKFAGNDLKASKEAHNKRDAKLKSAEVGPSPVPPGVFAPGVGFVPFEQTHELEAVSGPSEEELQAYIDHKIDEAVSKAVADAKAEWDAEHAAADGSEEKDGESKS